MNCESASIADGKLSVNFDGGSSAVDLDDIGEIRIFPHGYRNIRKTPPSLVLAQTCHDLLEAEQQERGYELPQVGLPASSFHETEGERKSRLSDQRIAEAMSRLLPVLSASPVPTQCSE